MDETELALHLLEDHDISLTPWVRMDLEAGDFHRLHLHTLEEIHADVHAGYPRPTARRAAEKRGRKFF